MYPTPKVYINASCAPIGDISTAMFRCYCKDSGWRFNSFLVTTFTQSCSLQPNFWPPNYLLALGGDLKINWF